MSDKLDEDGVCREHGVDWCIVCVTDELAGMPTKPKNQLSIDEAEARYPNSTIAMDFQIPHVVHGEDFRLKAGGGKSKRLQASCRLYGRHRVERVFRLLDLRSDWSPNEMAGDGPLYRAIRDTKHERLTATWHADVGLWCTGHGSFPINPQRDARKYPIKVAGETLDQHDFRVNIENVQSRLASAIQIPRDILYGLEGDQLIVDDPLGPPS